jgi:DNA polymerase-1
VTAILDQRGRQPRWVWWSAATDAPTVLDAGVAPAACWDLAAVGRFLTGAPREDPGALWAVAHDLPMPATPEPAAHGGALDLWPADAEPGSGPVYCSGQLNPTWAAAGPPPDLRAAEAWGQTMLALQQRQEDALRQIADPRPSPGAQPLALLCARAESAASLLAVELERTGLPLNREIAGRLLTDIAGPRPADDADAGRIRAGRDAEVLRHFPGTAADLRSPEQVRALLRSIGIDVPDTRSWRLEPYGATVPAVAALLRWRKAERVATTYGWAWLDRQVGADGRLRGAWRSADGGAGRMTAQAGLHNLPAELRSAVRAEPGYVLVRADLGQVEPRVLAVVSGDEVLATAARAPDMYAPVAAELRCDRPTAKIAVLAAMYGQTSGSAGQALQRMNRTYPQAIEYLRDAEAAGREGRDVRTYGGRRLPLAAAAQNTAMPQGSLGRFARNAVIQGAAAELFKAWAGTVRAGLPEISGELVLCLHDELLLHVPAEQAAAATALLHHALAATVTWWAAGSPVRFLADVTTGADWVEAH